MENQNQDNNITMLQNIINTNSGSSNQEEIIFSAFNQELGTGVGSTDPANSIDKPKYDKKFVLEIFERSKNETNNAKRQEIEKEIKGFSNNIVNFIQVIKEILLDSEIYKDSGAALSAVIYLKNILNTKLEKREIYTKDDVYFLMNELSPIFFLIGHFNKKINEILGVMLSNLLKNNYICNDGKAMSELFVNSLNNFKKDKTIQTFHTLYSIIYNVFNANIPDIVFLQLVSLAKNSLDSFAEFANYLLSNITSINNDSEIEYFTIVIDLKKKFFEILFLTSMKLKKAEKLSGEIKDELINSYLEYSMDTILYESREGSIISFTGNKLIDSAINGMKEKSFMWVSMLVQYESNDAIFNKKLIEKSIILFKLITDSFKYLIKNKMNYLAKMSGISNEYTDNEYNSIIFQANLFLSRVLIREPMISTMVTNIKE